MKKQAKNVVKAQTTETKAQTKNVTEVTTEEQVINLINTLGQEDTLLRTQDVTGYKAIKYGNKTLVELHIKKKSISHITFASSAQVFSYAKENKCILRVVPKSFGWRLDTEVLCTKENAEYILHIVSEIIKEHKATLVKKEKQAKKA